MTTQPSQQPLDASKGDRRTIFGWAMYDWANSAYATTVVVAILPVYFADAIIPNGMNVLGRHYDPEAVWAFMVSAAAVCVFLTAPVLGALADFAAIKKRFLVFFAYMGVTATCGLYFARGGMAWYTITLFLISQVGFISANVFYDAFLPAIADEKDRDWVSSRGFAYGYIGGGIQFALSLAIVSMHEKLGLDVGTAARVGMLFAALWWGGFALFTVFLVKEARVDATLPEQYRRYPAGLGYLALGYRRVWDTTRKFGQLKQLGLFVLAFIVYQDATETVIMMATIYGKQELRLSSTALMVTLLIIQFVAFGGSYLFGWIATRISARPAIILSLVGWGGVMVLGYFVTTTLQFFALGVCVGLVMGGSQSLSRSYYASLIPTHASA
ncbi:MAG: MFS transporter, partial [Candidatus Poribacteria bacterium]|nr:MFS transporter [Candidatus Poribacteria bacterium]